MVTVKYFASLRDSMGRSEDRMELADLRVVADVWRAVSGGAALPKTIFCAVNHSYADAQTNVRDGDEIAFFPQVTGG